MDTAVADVKANTDIVQLIERDLGPPPGKQHTPGKAFWNCPFHADKTPSLYVTSNNGRYHCFGCPADGDVITWIQETRHVSFQEALAYLGGDVPKLERPIATDRAEIERAAREIEEMALAEMADKWPAAIGYHKNMRDRSHWYSQGLTDASIDRWQLGYCPECPIPVLCVDGEWRKVPSHTIPITYGARLLNIRHRLATPASKGDKYRPEMAGLPALMFGYDMCADHSMLILVEGEVKAMVLTQHGFPAVGIPGAMTFRERWVPWFAPVAEVFVAFDPGEQAQAQAVRVCAMLGDKARRVEFQCKPDDFFVTLGGTNEQFQEYIDAARNGTTVGVRPRRPATRVGEVAMWGQQLRRDYWE